MFFKADFIKRCKLTTSIRGVIAAVDQASPIDGRPIAHVQLQVRHLRVAREAPIPSTAHVMGIGYIGVVCFRDRWWNIDEGGSA